MKNTTLLTDLYQLTMIQGYWKQGMEDRESVFHLFFRRAPFQGHCALACGIDPAMDWLDQLAFSADALAYLATLKGADQASLFTPEFLDFLRFAEWKLDVDAVEEGDVVFPHEPLIRVKGPLWQCQLVETALLNLANFQTLIATKAARICSAAGGDSVLEFGLRRAQGMDGGVSASRAAYIGGCAATSNVLAGMQFGIPVKGTHAHSWVMSFDSEQEAFDLYADALPNNVVLLVDTHDTIEGVKKAILTGKKLREKGHELLGVRLDSGDLAALSIEARKLLDNAGFENAAIVASNDLDEYRIAELKAAGAQINVWGVGTRLVTAFDQPALGGVYKLGAIRNTDGEWEYRIKQSDDPIKSSNPGILEVARYEDRDVIYEKNRPPEGDYRNLLKPAFLKGNRVRRARKLADVREDARRNWQQFENRLEYPVHLDEAVATEKERLIKEALKA